MSSADLATVVIACPSCGTRYQVPYGTLGKDGREVQCAQCGKPWHAMANPPALAPIDPDALFTPDDEARLDAAFEVEASAPAPPRGQEALDPDHARTLAEIRAVIAPRPKPTTVNNIDAKKLKEAARSFDRRQRDARQQLPLARFRRTARLAALVALVSLLLLGFALRVDLVRWFPSLAGVYASAGLPVNVVGLTIEDARTINTLREGKMVMQITARIRSVAAQPVAVPPVLVSLLGDSGNTVYEWTVAASLKEMEPGEVLDFSTEVNTPPGGTSKVRLSFTGRGTASASDKAS